jgi:hypothetical protein
MDHLHEIYPVSRATFAAGKSTFEAVDPTSAMAGLGSRNWQGRDCVAPSVSRDPPDPRQTVMPLTFERCNSEHDEGQSHTIAS